MTDFGLVNVAISILSPTTTNECMVVTSAVLLFVYTEEVCFKSLAKTKPVDWLSYAAAEMLRKQKF